MVRNVAAAHTRFGAYMVVVSFVVEYGHGQISNI